MSYEVYRIPVDSYDDPPECGVLIATFSSMRIAYKYADKTMERERDAESAYFVIDTTGRDGIYSVGYMES